MGDTTVIIKTIGRATVLHAFNSARREGFEVITILDGGQMPSCWTLVDKDLGYRHANTVYLGRRWGYYGGMAANVGAALAKTEFITFLDDDDEFAPGAGDIIRRKLKEKPQVDVWIAGVRFVKPIRVYNKVTDETHKVARDLAINGTLGVTVGNVAMPTYRTGIFSKIPFSDTVPKEKMHLQDFQHVYACQLAGCSIDWFGEVLYLVQPEQGGLNGRGQ